MIITVLLHECDCGDGCGCGCGGGGGGGDDDDDDDDDDDAVADVNKKMTMMMTTTTTMMIMMIIMMITTTSIMEIKLLMSMYSGKHVRNLYLKGSEGRISGMCSAEVESSAVCEILLRQPRDDHRERDDLVILHW